MTMPSRRPWNWFLVKLCELARTCSKMMARTPNLLSVSHAGLKTHRELSNVLHGPSTPSPSTNGCTHGNLPLVINVASNPLSSCLFVLRISAKQLIGAADLVDPAVRRSSRKRQDRSVCVCMCVSQNTHRNTRFIVRGELKFCRLRDHFLSLDVCTPACLSFQLRLPHPAADQVHNGW
jgi:hypothetical protein